MLNFSPKIRLCNLINQWFSNWGLRSFWGPRNNFLGPWSTFQKSKRRSWRKKIYKI